MLSGLSEILKWVHGNGKICFNSFNSLDKNIAYIYREFCSAMILKPKTRLTWYWLSRTVWAYAVYLTPNYFAETISFWIHTKVTHMQVQRDIILKSKIRLTRYWLNTTDDVYSWSKVKLVCGNKTFPFNSILNWDEKKSQF